MDSTHLVSLTAVLAPIFGRSAGGIATLLIGLSFVCAAALMFLPVADAKSPRWYQAAYGLIAWAALNRGRNAPVPPSGLPAGGLVPTPPHLQAQTLQTPNS